MSGSTRFFYGWIIVGAAMVVTCVGFGAMFSLGVFLQPMCAATGWFRTGISTAALLNFLCMDVGSFVWGALSDRLGTHAVVLLGGVLLGLGTVMASQAPTLGQFQVYFGLVVGFAAGSLYAPMTATTTRWFTRHSEPGPLSRYIQWRGAICGCSPWVAKAQNDD
jgi:MFS family permease